MGLKNYQYDVILRQFDARRLRSKYMLDKRTEEIYNKCPEILDIDNRIAEQSIARAKRAIFGDVEALTGLDEDNRKLTDEKKRLLVKNGYPAEYLRALIMSALSATIPALSMADVAPASSRLFLNLSIQNPTSVTLSKNRILRTSTGLFFRTSAVKLIPCRAALL